MQAYIYQEEKHSATKESIKWSSCDKIYSGSIIMNHLD